VFVVTGIAIPAMQTIPSKTTTLRDISFDKGFVLSGIPLLLCHPNVGDVHRPECAHWLKSILMRAGSLFLRLAWGRRQAVDASQGMVIAFGKHYLHHLSSRRRKEGSMYKRILVAVDGSNISNRALKEAMKLTKGKRTTLRLIHVVDETPVYMPDMPFLIDKFQKEMRQAGRKVLADSAARAKRTRVDTKLVIINNPAQRIGGAINNEAKRWRADLIVIGTHGRRGFSRLTLGSAAEGVIRLAAKPILVIHGR
jgi:nucleotide-binding universal stress UspA family protein